MRRQHAIQRVGKLLQQEASGVQRADGIPRNWHGRQAALHHAHQGSDIKHGLAGGRQVFGERGMGSGVDGLGGRSDLGGFFIQHVQHPTTEGFSLVGIGQHAQQVRATQREHPHLLDAASSRKRHDLGHVGGEFIGVASMQVFDVNRWVFVAQGTCNLQPP